VIVLVVLLEGSVSLLNAVVACGFLVAKVAGCFVVRSLGGCKLRLCSVC
jgi:hypothetical protein